MPNRVERGRRFDGRPPQEPCPDTRSRGAVLAWDFLEDFSKISRRNATSRVGNGIATLLRNESAKSVARFARERIRTRRMTKSSAVDVERLESDVVWALERGLGPRDLVPMLERLKRHAPRGSTAACFANIELAELLLQTRPWRAALLAREVLA